MNKKLSSLLIIIVVYIAATVFSYGIFSKVASNATKEDTVEEAMVDEDGTAQFDNKLPKTQECPLNGAMYSKQQEAWWQKHRPLGVMVENHVDARPQSGMQLADVTYEAVAEGGITRFLNVYYCDDAGQVGPVRSARTYFLDWISEYGSYPLYAHVGGANKPGPADALGQINEYGWGAYNDLSEFGLGAPTFKRISSPNGYEVATEHTMFSSTAGLWKAATTRDLTDKDKDGESWDTTFVPYKFKDDAPASERPSKQVINISFWESQPSFDVTWTYDAKTNTYLRSTGGKQHVERNTKKQIFAKDVIVLFMKESVANDGYEDGQHLLYANKGTTGKATIFMNGKEIKGTWSKEDRESRTIIKDASGKEITFVRGKMWFEILPLDGTVTVQ